MQSCEVCGQSFDPLRFQVVVPELGRGFDRMECAQSARALAGPGARIAAAPLVAIADPFVAVAPAAAAAARRNFGPSAATALGLLAAGTAAAVLLWVRVLGADPSSFMLGRLTPPPAFGHETVLAEAAPAPAPASSVRPPAGHTETATVERVVFVPGIHAPPPAVSIASPSRPRPSSPSTTSRPAKSSAEPGKTTGKGHRKHGKGHYKHGEEDGMHEAGHGNGKGSEAGKAGHGHGHGKGKGKH